jgi:hypothetical protein
MHDHRHSQAGPLIGAALGCVEEHIFGHHALLGAAVGTVRSANIAVLSSVAKTNRISPIITTQSESDHQSARKKV